MYIAVPLAAVVAFGVYAVVAKLSGGFNIPDIVLGWAVFAFWGYVFSCFITAAVFFSPSYRKAHLGERAKDGASNHETPRETDSM
jgi:hypothetical protein